MKQESPLARAFPTRVLAWAPVPSAGSGPGFSPGLTRLFFAARRRETLVLDDHDLVIRRISPEGEEELIRLEAYWLKVHWDEADERLIVSSRRSRAVIGRFLPPVERRRVADQLKAALAAMRAPRYRHAWDDA